MSITLTGGNIISPFREIKGGTLCIENEKISYVGEENKQVGEVIDVSGLNVTPGFIDLHIHGGGGHEFWTDDPEEIKKAGLFHAEHGVTSVLPTVGVEGSIEFTDEMKRNFDAYDKACKDKSVGPELLGIHLEGPYASPEQPMAGYKVIIPVKEEEYGKFLDYCPYIVKWTVAPEIPGALDFISAMAKRGVYTSIGHSSAEYDMVCEAFERGANQMTHLYSGMTMTHRVNGLRYPGLVEASYLLDDIFVEVIGNGTHLCGDLLNFVYKNKGAGHMCIVSDGSTMTGTPDGPIEYHGRKGFIENGVIVKEDRSGFMGSVTTYDKMFYNLLYKAKIPMKDAVRMTSTSPANAIGLGNRKGKLTVGYDGDVIAFDDDVNIKLVVIKGEVVYNKL